MRIVEERLDANDNVPAKAIRAVLQEAIERLRPSGERSATASEWVIYNILDFKYIQGQRIRDITRRMAMSDSDYYRKQRVAIEQVAETLSLMEQSVQAHRAEEAQGPPPMASLASAPPRKTHPGGPMANEGTPGGSARILPGSRHGSNAWCNVTSR